MSGDFPILYDTSRAKAYLDCQRKRWHGYEYPTGLSINGLERLTMNVALSTGIYEHIALDALLNGVEVESAVETACGSYRAEVKRRGLELDIPTEGSYVVEEQAALVEGLARAAAIVVVPKLLAQYELLETEREDQRALDAERSVVLMARTDAVLRRRSDGLLFVLNWKTASTAGDAWAEGFETDMQTVSEPYAIEPRLGERIAGVLVIGLIKGKQMPEKDGDGNIIRWRQSTPLIYAYKKLANPPALPEDTYRYDYVKNWKKSPIWEDERYTVKSWVESLPPEVLEAQFQWVPPITRNERDVEHWRQQSIAREHDVRAKAEASRQAYPEHREQMLDELFPQNTEACQRFGKRHRCAFYGICWDGQTGADPLGSGLYRPRTANHPYEIEMVAAATAEHE